MRNAIRRILCAAAVLTLAGCASAGTDETADVQAEDRNPAAEEGETSAALHETYMEDEGYAVLYRYITALREEDWQEAAECLKPTEDTVISPAEARKTAKNSALGGVVGRKSGTYSLEEFTRTTDSRCRIAFDIGSSQFEAAAAKGPDDRWYACVPEAAYAEFTVAVPAGAQVYWDELCLSEIMQPVPSEKDGDVLDRYTFQCIQNVSVTLQAVCPGFRTLTEKIEKKVAGAEYEIDRTFREEERQACFQAVQALYNDMHTDVVNGIPEDEFYQKYFSVNVGKSEAEALYDAIVKTYGERTYGSVRMTDTAEWENKYVGLLRSDTAEIHFVYTLEAESWVQMRDGFGTAEGAEKTEKKNLKGSIRLQKKDGLWRIYEVTDISLFQNGLA